MVFNEIQKLKNALVPYLNDYEITIHHVKLVNGQYLMSKHGPCNNNDTSVVEVGCLDGFECIENQCRDPNSKTQEIPYEMLFNLMCHVTHHVHLDMNFTLAVGKTQISPWTTSNINADAQTVTHI